MTRAMASVDDVLARAMPEPNTGCWLWAESLNRGYGYCSFMGRRTGAHIAALVLARGPLARGMCALHRCDTPACVNPDHLFAGTQADNNRDRTAKGRSARGDRNGMRLHPERLMRGEAQAQSKLTAARVLEMHQRVAGGESRRAVAAAFGVSPSTASAIIRGERWRHVLPVHASEVAS